MNAPAVQRTRQEIETLKRQWEADPCWDIEDTEGFEAHREELKQYGAARHAEWAKRREDDHFNRVRTKATALRLDPIAQRLLLDWILSTEDRLVQIEARAHAA